MEDFYLLLDQYIEKFQKTLPSLIEDKDVIALEDLINKYYLDQIEKGCPAELENALIDALSWVSTMVNEIKRNEDGKRGNEFYRTTKQVANLLKRIRYYAR